MKINSQTKISTLIKHNKEAINAIASLNQHFKKLQNPLLRAVLAPRVTLMDASKIGKCPINDLYATLEKIGFEIDQEEIKVEEMPEFETKISEKTIDFIGNNVNETIDVRPIIAAGEDPFTLLLKKVKALNEFQTLEIVNSFEPIPLIRILQNKGYACLTTCSEDVYYTIVKVGGNKTTIEGSDEIEFLELDAFNEFCQSYDSNILEIDVRDLEMPLPMVTILNELEEMPEGFALKVYHKKVPQYLLPELQARDFKTKAHEIDEGNVLLLIHT